VTNIKLFRKQ